MCGIKMVPARQGIPQYVSERPSEEDLSCPEGLELPLDIYPNVPFVREMIVDYSKFDISFTMVTCFEKPRRHGYYSCLIKPDGKILYQEDMKALRYLQLPNNDLVSINLKDGITDNFKLDQSSCDNFLLQFISNNYYQLEHDSDTRYYCNDAADDDDDEDKPIADFICTSKVLTLIMTTPYNKNKAWNLVGVNVRGALVLKEKVIPEQTKSSYERRKFLEGITRLYDGSKRDPDGYDLFYTVSRGKVANHRLLYSSNISAATSRNSDPIDEKVFAQTVLRPIGWDVDSKSKKNFWRQHGPSLWCSLLLGKINGVIFGDKEPGGWVKILTKVQSSDIPKSSNSWSPKTCADFMDQLFTFIRSASTPELIPFEINFNPVSGINGNITIKTLDEPPEKYVPIWYINNQTPDTD